MERCVFCDTGVSLVEHEGELAWLDQGGGTSCDTGGLGAHYPGKEADLFWRGSALRSEEVIDLTAGASSVQLEVVPGSRSSSAR
jgi:hypothetical protein